jgi:Kef-type K+ transport system membrane component KefB
MVVPVVTLPYLPTDVAYIVLLFLLFVLPRFLQRFGIPSALTALGFGALAGLGLGVSHGDQTIRMLATLGIVSLFLFAGLDVELAELRRERKILVEHVVVRVLMLLPTAFVCEWVFGIDRRAGFLTALALLTPSTGFILDSLAGWGLSTQERFWIRSKAIATELVALAVMFIVLQSTSWTRIGLSALVLLAMVAVLPAVFRWFASVIVPHAPRSEFGFLVIIAAACAVVTRSLGVYYLVGAFVVGMSAQRFRSSLPALSSDRMLHAVEAFASLFIPFYFLQAGLELSRDDFTRWSVVAGAAFIAVMVPLRLLLVAGHRSFRFGEGVGKSLRVGAPMLPTTVFTLVITELLRERFQVPPFLLGGLIIYMLANTLVPSLALRRPVLPFEDELQLEIRVESSGSQLPAGQSRLP